MKWEKIELDCGEIFQRWRFRFAKGNIKTISSSIRNKGGKINPYTVCTLVRYVLGWNSKIRSPRYSTSLWKFRIQAVSPSFLPIYAFGCGTPGKPLISFPWDQDPIRRSVLPRPPTAVHGRSTIGTRIRLILMKIYLFIFPYVPLRRNRVIHPRHRNIDSRADVPLYFHREPVVEGKCQTFIGYIRYTLATPALEV